MKWVRGTNRRVSTEKNEERLPHEEDLFISFKDVSREEGSSPFAKSLYDFKSFLALGSWAFMIRHRKR